MAKQAKDQKETVERVMHEFKHGELETGSGKKVKSRRQAVAIGLSEAGSSNQQIPKENAERRKETNARERRGATAKQSAEGGGSSRAELYEKAKRKNVSGRSKMSKGELARAVAS
jgi:hypothetical protein